MTAVFYQQRYQLMGRIPAFIAHNPSFITTISCGAGKDPELSVPLKLLLDETVLSVPENHLARQ